MFSPIIGLGFSKWGKKRINIPEIIKKHVEQWAKEFFCGYNPPYWHNKFGFEVSPNGRFAEHEQITDFESLQEIVSEVHKYWKRIMMNINHWYYTDVVWNELKQMIEDGMKAWVDGFIVSAFEVLEYLDEISEGTWERGYIINWKKYYLNISTIMAVYNPDAISFLKENYPIHKVILSRELTLKEIKLILDNFDDILFEVFWEWDFCRYNNGLCFAEHKYTDRDICTIVVNDWIKKKAIKYDFRKIIWNDELENNEKVKLFDNEYLDEFQQLEKILEEYFVSQENNLLDELSKLIKLISWKYILFYDPLQGPNTTHNKNFMLVVDAVNLLLEKGKSVEVAYFENLEKFKDYLLTDLQLAKKQYLENLKNFIGEKFGIEAKYKDDFYNRADLLNIYSYVYFDQFKNLDTVKFPTRWRNYLPKIKIINECMENPDKIMDKLSLNDSFERAHYDLKSLFDDNKFWFYDIRKKLHEKITASQKNR